MLGKRIEVGHEGIDGLTFLLLTAVKPCAFINHIVLLDKVLVEPFFHDGVILVLVLVQKLKGP